MKKFLLFFSLTFSILQTAFSQKEANIWCFGNSSGIDFNSGSPVAFSGVAMNAFEGCASIADGNGNLLFYTEGYSVWDRTHTQMPNGFGLLGGTSSTQSAIIIQQPGTTAIYYIFTAVDFVGAAGIGYTIVDMTLNGGLGDVTIKNVQMITPADERLTASRHANGSDIWIIGTTNNGDNFYSWMLTSAGLNMTPVITPAGITHLGGQDFIGYLKASPQGNHLGMALYTTGQFDLYDFDNATGIVSNPIAMPSASYSGSYGCEFSPDGTKFYGAAINVSQIYQFDLLAGSSAAIIASATLVGTAPSVGEIQLAPDNKIYADRQGQNTLGVINDPNTLGVACNYVDNFVSLGIGTCSWGLPNFMPNLLTVSQPPTINFVASDRYICPETCISFTNFTQGATSYEWTFPGGNPGTSTDVNPAVICYSTPGNYSVTLIATNSVGSDTVTLANLIHVYPQPAVPVITQVGDILFATAGYLSYQWYYGSDTIPGAVGSYYVATQSGNYNLVVTDSNGCVVGVGILNVIADVNHLSDIEHPISILPNPNMGTFSIVANGIREKVFVEIFSSIGQVVYRKEADFSISNKLDVISGSMSKGIYSLKIISGNNNVTMRLVVE